MKWWYLIQLLKYTNKCKINKLRKICYMKTEVEKAFK